MALTASLMASMSHDHLLSAVEAELDPMTSTDLERELVKRLDEMLEWQDVIDAIEAAGLEANDIRGIAEAMADNSCDTPADLRAKLECADKFYDIAAEAGDVISRLSELVSNTQ